MKTTPLNLAANLAAHSIWRRRTQFAATATATLLSLLDVGCATSAMTTALRSASNSTQGMADLEDRIADMSKGEADTVRVIRNELPPGMTATLMGVQVDPALYQLRGYVAVGARNSFAADYGLLPYAYNDDESWRRVYCGAQIPLAWATLTMWSWLIPFHWACHVGYSTDSRAIARDEERMVVELQKGAKALGANVVVVSLLVPQISQAAGAAYQTLKAGAVPATPRGDTPIARADFRAWPLRY